MQNIYLFYGPDHFSRQSKIKSWIKQFSEKYGTDDLQTIEGKTIQPNDFLTNLTSLPFLSEKRLIIVKDFLSEAKEETQKHLTEKLIKIPDFTILIFNESTPPDKRKTPFKKLTKIATTQEFSLPTPQQLTDTISQQTSIPKNLANQIIAHVGPDLLTLHNEIAKLKIYKPNLQITAEDIKQLCTPSLQTSIFNLTDQLSQKQIKKALNTLNQLTQSAADPIRTFFMLVRHFRILIQIKALKEENLTEKQIQNILKLHPFVIKKTLQQTHNFTQTQLNQIYQNFLDIEHRFKTGKIKTQKQDHKEYLLAIEKLIISI